MGEPGVKLLNVTIDPRTLEFLKAIISAASPFTVKRNVSIELNLDTGNASIYVKRDGLR